MKFLNKILLILTLIFITIFKVDCSWAIPKSDIDSLDICLQKNYENEASPREFYKVLRQLYELTKISNPYSAIEYAGQALQIANTEKNDSEIAFWTESIANVYFNQKSYYMAMERYFEAYSSYKLNKDYKKAGYSLLRYGDTYFMQNAEVSAMTYYRDADSLFLKYKYKEGHAEALDRIGVIELGRFQYNAAMNYFTESLKISQEIKNPSLSGLAYDYIAKVHEQNDDFEEEEKYLNLAVIQYRIADDKYEVAKIFYRLGNMYTKYEEYDKANTSYKQAENVFGTFGQINYIASIYAKTGRIKYIKNDIRSAKKLAEKSLALCDLNGWMEEKADALLLMSDIYNSMENKDEAYKFMHRYSEVSDSIYENRKAESFSELQVIISTQEKEKQLALYEKKMDQRNRYTIAAVIAAVILLFFLIYAIKQNRKVKNMNLLLTETNEEINQKNSEILRQKEIVDTVNKEIKIRNQEIESINESMNSSIKYAASIQHAMLPSSIDFIKQHFADGFVYFYPREVVSGDFYWFAEVKEQRPPTLFRRKNVDEDEGSKLIMAVIDCTGHGVPGAFMSMLGDAFMSQIVNLQKITRPDLILNELHKLVRITLQQENTENNDGMDVAIVTIDKANHLMQFAGAKNPLVYIQDGKVEKINGDLQSIGGIQKEDERTFECHDVDITKSTTFYIYSDGYQDQFGGSVNRKFMAKRFRELLGEISSEPFDKQPKILRERFDEWRGKKIQMDDTTIVGIKIS